MTIMEEQAAVRAEHAAEVRRRWIAACLCVASAIAAAFALLAMAKFPGHVSDSILRSLLAMLLGATLVLGARALDGPIRLREHRRGQSASSEAAAALVLWLGCFAAIMAALLASDLVARVDVAGRAEGAGAMGSDASKSSKTDGTAHVVINNQPRISQKRSD